MKDWMRSDFGDVLGHDVSSRIHFKTQRCQDLQLIVAKDNNSLKCSPESFAAGHSWLLLETLGQCTIHPGRFEVWEKPSAFCGQGLPFFCFKEHQSKAFCGGSLHDDPGLIFKSIPLESPLTTASVPETLVRAIRGSSTSSCDINIQDIWVASIFKLYS